MIRDKLTTPNPHRAEDQTAIGDWEAAAIFQKAIEQLQDYKEFRTKARRKSKLTYFANRRLILTQATRILTVLLVAFLFSATADSLEEKTFIRVPRYMF